MHSAGLRILILGLVFVDSVIAALLMMAAGYIETGALAATAGQKIAIRLTAAVAFGLALSGSAVLGALYVWGR